jgi:chemotaxis protein methyltransferase CheR
MENYEEFKTAVYQLTKIDLSAYKEKQMRRRIDSLITKNLCNSYENYLKLLRSDACAFDEFINFLTINVSEFYRNPDQWDLLTNEFTPELIEKFGKDLHVWSAACSTGDEPYSLVMALSKHIDISRIRIHATDLDKQVIATAKVGLYSAKSIANVPQQYKSKFFTQIGNSYQISDQVKRCVDFKEHNLLADSYPKGCHLIVCRNVVIYFTDEAKTDVYQKFSDSLRPGGILFIGSTEQVTNYRELGFKRRYSFYYEKA